MSREEIEAKKRSEQKAEEETGRQDWGKGFVFGAVRRTEKAFIGSIEEALHSLRNGKPKKTQLEEGDLMLKLSLSSTDEFSYMAVENMEKSELLSKLERYQTLYGENGEMPVESYLEQEGAKLTPWYNSRGFAAEYAVYFYDVEYDYDTGVHSEADLPCARRAEMLIDRAEYKRTVFLEEDRDLLVNFAYKYDDIEETKELVQKLAEAAGTPGLETAAEELREEIQRKIDFLPDGMAGITQLHEYGCQDPGILPLTMGRAAELYEKGQPVLRLERDGSSAPVSTKTELLEHEGLFGIQKEDWENCRGMEALHKEEEERPSPEGQITFYAAECMECPVLGEYYGDLTLKEAAEQYQKLPEGGQNGSRGIGFRLDEGKLHIKETELMSNGRITLGSVHGVDLLQKSPLVRKAVKELKSMLPELAELSGKQPVLKKLSDRQAKREAQGKKEQKLPAHRKGGQEL